MAEKAGRYTSRNVFEKQFASAVELQSETKKITAQQKTVIIYIGHYGPPE
jgi:hypothetical protein